MKGTKKEFKNQGKTSDITSTISNFFNEFHLGTLLNRSGISKVRGFSPTILLHDIFHLPFLNKNFFQGIVRNPAICYSKDVAYDFLKNSRYNWRKLLLLYAIKRALSLGVKAQYILMDSWFGFPSVIKTLSASLPVICMVKKMLALLEDLIHHSHSCSHCIIDGFIKEILSTFVRFFIDTRPIAT